MRLRPILSPSIVWTIAGDGDGDGDRIVALTDGTATIDGTVSLRPSGRLRPHPERLLDGAPQAQTGS